MEIDQSFNHAQYAKNIDSYNDTNQDTHIGGASATERVKQFAEFLPEGSKVFEVGAGFGDDALALAGAGYEVHPTDFVKEFVELMRQKGLDAEMFDALSDDFPTGYDALYANAVFVHFSPEQTKAFLVKAREALTGQKLVFLSVIKGESQERRAGSQIGFERDFQDYNEEMIQQVLSSAGFKLLHIELVDDRWLQVVAEAA